MVATMLGGVWPFNAPCTCTTPLTLARVYGDICGAIFGAMNGRYGSIDVSVNRSVRFASYALLSTMLPDPDACSRFDAASSCGMFNVLLRTCSTPETSPMPWSAANRSATWPRNSYTGWANPPAPDAVNFAGPE